VADPDDMQTEFAVVVRSDLKGTGLGMMLMRKLIDYCRRRGIREMVGETMPDNAPLLNMATRLGFTVKPQPADGVMKLRLPLNPRSARD
jgi:acetyltransferase